MLSKYSMGVGDRFGRQGVAQLQAFLRAQARGVEITPVWNKSHREHSILGSRPADTRSAADAAVRTAEWNSSYCVDADHIGLSNVDGFLDSCDFFTLDVAAALEQRAGEDQAGAFARRHPELIGSLSIAGLDAPVEITAAALAGAAARLLPAAGEAARVYRHIREGKDARPFVTEVSMDETGQPQSPVELLVVLAALADERVPVNTIAPRFCGEFHKGVDYQGDPERFEREFAADVAVIRHAVNTYDLPAQLKLSVHSGSDKFSLYPRIGRVLAATGAGLHLKTAGTTWLEELIGLAESGGEGLAVAKEVYTVACARRKELCAPYAAVVSIRADRLPAPAAVVSWSAVQFTSALRHEPSNPEFNPDLRQLLHVAYGVAAQMGGRYLRMLEQCSEQISGNVTRNLYDRHMLPLFFAQEAKA